MIAIDWIRNKNGYFGALSPFGQLWVRQEYGTMRWYWDCDMKRHDKDSYPTTDKAMLAAEMWIGNKL